METRPCFRGMADLSLKGFPKERPRMVATLKWVYTERSFHVSEEFTDQEGLVRWHLIVGVGNGEYWKALKLKHIGPPIPHGKKLPFVCEYVWEDAEKNVHRDKFKFALRYLDANASSSKNDLDYDLKQFDRTHSKNSEIKVCVKIWYDSQAVAVKQPAKPKAQFPPVTPPDLRSEGPLRFANARLAIRGHVGPDTPVHKAVLAQSPVFARMLESELEEGQTCRIALDGVTPEAFKGLVDFLYTGKASGLRTDAEQLLDLGEQYELPELKEQAMFALKNLKLSPACVADTYRSAERFASEPLKAACKQVLLGPEGSQVAGLADLLKDFPALAYDVAMAKLK